MRAVGVAGKLNITFAVVKDIARLAAEAGSRVAGSTGIKALKNDPITMTLAGLHLGKKPGKQGRRTPKKEQPQPSLEKGRRSKSRQT